MKKIKIQQAILNAIEESDASAARFHNQMMRWAKYLEREIGSKLGYTYKAKKFTVNGCIIELPDDCYAPVMILPGDYEDQCNVKYITDGWIPIRTDPHGDDDFSWLWRPAEAYSVDEYLWEEIGEEIHLVNTYSSMEMTLVYQAIETDQMGFWLVNESHIDAITKFIIFKIAKKFKWKLFKSDKLLRSGHVEMINDLKNDYNHAVRNARAQDATESSLERAKY